MAEARLAVAFQFAVTDDGQLNVHVDKDVFHHVFRALVKSVKRKYKSAKHNFLKWHFPATPMAWVLFFLALAAARIGEHQPTLGILGRVEQALPGYVIFSNQNISVEKYDIPTTCVWFRNSKATKQLGSAFLGGKVREFRSFRNISTIKTATSWVFIDVYS
jgi:hypothetical protein